MKVLLITDEAWNDRVHGNNVLSNWFCGFPAKFAQIYCSPQRPSNSCCDNYFQITDKMMLKSLFGRYRAGRTIEKQTEMINEVYQSTDVKNIDWMRSCCGNLLRLLKNIVWSFGKYDEKAMEDFITDFKPDIIFSPRMATPKMLRLERIVKRYSDCPIVAFTGDNEYSLRMFSLSPIAWINKFWLRRELRRNMKLYSAYYTLSDEQKKEYEKNFQCTIKILRKCADINSAILHQEVHTPIKLIYAGKLYCNRWKTLVKIGQALEIINENHERMTLDIYTKDVLSIKQEKAIGALKSLRLHGGITQEEVLQEYRNSDVALHIESFDIKYRLATRVSFSTKIIDCLSCGCAVMVVAWKEHSGLTYLQREDAAICIDDCNQILRILKEMSDNPELLSEYSIKAIDCLKRNHCRGSIQRQLFEEWVSIIQKKSIKVKSGE